MHNPESILENEKPKLGFWDTNRSLNFIQTTKPSDIQQQQKKKKKG